MRIIYDNKSHKTARRVARSAKRIERATWTFDSDAAHTMSRRAVLRRIARNG